MTTLPQAPLEPRDQGERILAAAREHAAAGVRIFPVHGLRRVVAPETGGLDVRTELRCGCGDAACPNPGKHPVGLLVPNGHNGATTEPGTIDRWFRLPPARDANGWIPYNLGVATGRGLVVVDADVKQARPDLPTGLDVLDDWETWTQGTTLPDTLTIRTGGGGRHLWLRVDRNVRVAARNRVLPGIDLKGDGGYVLATPSLHVSGRYYEITRDLEAAEASVELVAWLLTVRGGRYVTKRAGDAAGVVPDEYDFRAIVGGVRGCAAGHRDYFVNDLCFRLRRAGSTVEEAARALRREWLRMEQPAGDEFPWESCLYKLRRVWDEVTPQEVVDIPAWRPPSAASATSGAVESEDDDGLVGLSAAEALVRPELTFLLTDTGNGIRFAQRMREVVRYCAGENRWYTWDGLRWRLDAKRESFLLTEEVVKDLYVEASRLPEHERDRVERWAITSQSVARREAMLSAAGAQPGIAIEPDDLDRDPWLLVVRNGTLDLRTGALRASDPRDLCTRLAEVDFDAGSRAPLWLKHVEFVTDGDDVLAEWLRRAVGYTLTGLTDEQKLFFLWGNGANGKSTFVDVVASMLGSYAAQADAGLLVGEREHPTQLAGLRGARLVVADETEAGRRLAERRIKALTGGKKVRARYMRQDYFEFTPRFKIWITGNHKPEVAGTDGGIWRRLKLVPFRATLDDDRRILGYDEVLHQELPGILNWALDGLAAWRTIGGLGEPEVVGEATREYRSEEDTIGLWLSERADLGVRDAAAANAQLYESYRWWCHANGIQDVRSNVALGRELAARGLRREIVKLDGKTTRVWYGVALREQ